MRWTGLLFVLCIFCSKQVQSNGNKNCSTSFLESTPFFQKCPTRFKSQQILFLTEFSRFMNMEVPNMLKRFVENRQVYQAKRRFEKLRRINEDVIAATKPLLNPSTEKEAMEIRTDYDYYDVTDERTNRKTRSLIQQREMSDETSLLPYLLSSTQEAIKMARSIVKAVEDSVNKHDYTYPHYWEVACKAQWWPFDDGTCNQMRCTACAPSIMSAAAVCRAREQTLAYKCMQGIIGEGFCNYCIVDYLD